MFKKSMYAVLTIAVFMFLSISTLSAQDLNPDEGPVYFLAPDDLGVDQVYQLLFDGQSEARQITHTDRGVLNFVPAPDGLSVAYISAGQLWLQSIHTQVPIELATIDAAQFFNSPIFSPDSQYIAYQDNGVWLMDVATRETHQILEDVQLDEQATNGADSRSYYPKTFALDVDGQTKLIVDISLYEWNSEGVYDLATGNFTELQGLILVDRESLPNGLPLSEILPLADGRALVYGLVNLDVLIYVAESLEMINPENPQLVTVMPSTYENVDIYPTHAIEVQPGFVRIYGPASTLSADDATAFYFDFDLGSGIASEVQLVTLAQSYESDNTIMGTLSPNGSLLSVYLNAVLTEAGVISGEIRFIDLTTGEMRDLALPENARLIQW